jgi:hypothetical protein
MMETICMYLVFKVRNGHIFLWWYHNDSRISLQKRSWKENEKDPSISQHLVSDLDGQTIKLTLPVPVL